MIQTHEPAPKRRSITGQLLLMGHRLGVHPVPHGADGRSLRWVGPTRPAILPLDGIRLPDRFVPILADPAWSVGPAADPRTIVEACDGGTVVAASEWAESPPASWIAGEMRQSYLELAGGHHIQAIGVRRNGRLVAGLFGIAIGAVFFGEGLFSRVRDGGEVALAELLGRLHAGGFRFVDLRFLGGHSASVETKEHVRGRYRAPESALNAKATFPLSGGEMWRRSLPDLQPAAARHAQVA